MKQPFLSIIIPAFNEEARLPETLRQIAGFAEQQKYDVEVIVVDNASTDRTGQIVTEYGRQHPFIRHLYASVKGKGAAIRKGIFEAKGDHLLICDADLAVPVQYFPRFVSPELDGFGVVIASRQVEGAKRINEPLHRYLMSRVFNLIVRLAVLPGVSDTQCGFKCFKRGPGRDIFAHGQIDGFAFDVEILHVARLKGHRIAEVPVEWNYGDKSTIKPFRDTLRMLKELMLIKKNIKKEKKQLHP